MAVPFQNCTIDIWDNLIPAPGVGPNQGLVPAAILRPLYPIAVPQYPSPGIPLIYRILIQGSFFFTRPIWITGSGAYNYNIFFRINPEPHTVRTVYRIVSVSPAMKGLGNGYWYAYAIWWGDQP